MRYNGQWLGSYAGYWCGDESIPPIPPEPPELPSGGGGYRARGTLSLKPAPIIFRHGMADDWGRIPKNIAPKTIKARAVAKKTRKQQDIDYLAITDLMLYELTAQQMLMQEQIEILQKQREEDEEIAILLTLGVL